MSERALNVYEVLRQEFERLHGPAEHANIDWDQLPKEKEEAKVREMLPKLYAEIHSKNRSALCFSGGGIRSATFSLGVMQRLASIGLLPLFDFLSTVSGGGYIGSWLSSYVRRSPKAIHGVAEEISAPPASVLDPEPQPIRHLRDYSNYLSPRLGLFSGDTWSLIGSYLRNLLLNWLILIPLFAAVLAIPRLVVAVMRHQGVFVDELRFVTAGLFAVALVYLALARPVRNRVSNSPLYGNRGFIAFVVVPFFLASVGAALLAAWTWDNSKTRPWWTIFLVMVGASAFSSLLYMTRYGLANRNENRGYIALGTSLTAYTIKKFINETLAAAVSAGVATGLLWLANKFLFNDPRVSVKLAAVDDWKDFPAVLSGANAEIYVCFAVPLVMGVLFVQSALFNGLSSWFNEDYDREWWARAGGWVLVTALAWILFTGITIYGPVLIYMAPRLFASFGAVAGAFTVFSGKSGKTAGSGEQKEDETKSGTAMNVLLGLAAPIFVVCFLALISLITSRIVLSQSETKRLTDSEIAFYSSGTYHVKETEKVGNRDRVFETSKYPAIEKDRVRALEHLYAVDRAKVGSIWPILAASLLGWVISLFVGVNKFSMHAFYRNRLIRAYLGASRWTRTPNPFTGFDPYDNLQMHELRAELLWVHSYKNLDDFVAALTKRPNGEAGAMLQYLYDNLAPRTRSLLDDYTPGAHENKLVCELLFEDLNSIIDEHDLTAKPPVPKPYDPGRSLANRRHLDRVLEQYLNPAGDGRPFHIINTALNLVTGKKLAWQQRKASSFSVSPLHCGNRSLGYRFSREYGGPDGISLGTSVAISGAAASPNMGYHSSPALSFLLTLFNVRLGWWLGNPGPKGDKTYRLRNPRTSLRPLLGEVFGTTDEDHPYVYLSDGGHFENLGIYEMVLRRCKNIVVIDAGADQDYIFEDLGNAVRKIRIDLGIPITMKQVDLYPRNKLGNDPKYCAIGDIHYGTVDAGATDGKLLYLKPAFYGKSEPRDVYNYAQTSQTFPHESTGDQWFSESQFESYRALGYFALGELLPSDAKPADLGALIAAAEAYLQPQTAEII